MAKPNTSLKEPFIPSQCVNIIINRIAEGVIFVDNTGTILTYNDAAKAILEKDPAVVLLRKFWDVFDDQLFGFSMHEALKSQQNPEFTTINIPQLTGDVRKVDIHILFVSEGTGVIILLKDSFSERDIRMRELGEVASLLTHEIRNPLGGIKGFASLLQRDLKDYPELQMMAGHIVKGADNLNRLITNVLNYARPLKLHLEETDLVALLNDVVKNVQVDPNLAANINIKVESEIDPFKIAADPKVLRSALFNLVMNAIQAMPDGGTLTVALSKEPCFAVIKIIDTGIGIPPENMQKIFTPFFTTKPDGNGFGVVEVKKAIQAHKGSIGVESEVSKGTTFTVKLPLEGPSVCL